MVTAREEELTTDALVIGAGPAGIAAANQLARRSVEVVVVDENQRPGGQIDRLRFVSDAQDTQRLVGGRLAPEVAFLGGTVCHGFASPGRAVLSRAGRGHTIDAKQVIVATGGQEVAYPLPGWTLPGVMTAGAAQTLLKGSGGLPYRRVVVAGTGPLLLATACQLLDHGVDVVAVVDGYRPSVTHWRDALRTCAAPSLLGQGARYLARLRRAGVGMRFGAGVREIEGQRAVEGAWIGPLAADWTPTGRADLLDCDAVLLCHGFSSVTELVAQADGAIRWDEQRRDWVPTRDETFRTTAHGVRAVGDCAGVAGAQVAALEGQLAGLWAAAELTGRPPGSTVAPLQRKLRRLERFRTGMDNLFRTKPGAGAWAAPGTEICRCEHVPRSVIDRAVANGVGDPHGVKLWTRAGMGPCQGRTCSAGVCALLERQGLTRAEMPPPTARFPVRPLLIDAVPDGPTTHQEDMR